VSDTPRTDEFFYERARRPGVNAWLRYARTIERELTDSNAELRRLYAVNAELLEALRLFVDDAHTMTERERLEKARAAIARAEEVKP
jgi:plasmid stabilization system protein ParE